MAKRVNKAELEQILGLSHTTLTEYQEQGLPIEIRGDRGEEHEYDTAKVVEWLIQRALTRAGKNKSALEIEMLELQVGEARAKAALREQTLVPADRVRPIWESRVLAAAFSLTGRHSRLAGILEATPGIEAKRAILKTEDADFLTKLGVDGERMQRVVDEMLEKLSAGEAEAFLRRLASHDDDQRRGGTAEPAG